MGNWWEDLGEHPTSQEIVEFTGGLLKPGKARAVCNHAKYCHPCAIEIAICVYVEYTPRTELEIALAGTARKGEIAQILVEALRE